VDNRIQTRLEKADQLFRRFALATVRLFIKAAELLLGNISVVALELLLGTELLAEIGKFALAALTMLTGAIFTAVDRRFGPTPNVFAKTAVELVLGGMAFAHRISFSI